MDFGQHQSKASFWRWVAATDELRKRFCFPEHPEWDWRVYKNEHCKERGPGLTHVGERICETCGIAIRS